MSLTRGVYYVPDWLAGILRIVVIYTKVHFRGNVLLTSFYLLQERYNIEGNYGFLHGIPTSRSFIQTCMCVHAPAHIHDHFLLFMVPIRSQEYVSIQNHS